MKPDFRHLILIAQKRQKVSRNRLSKEAKIDPKALKAYLEGARELTGDRIENILRVLGVDLRYKITPKDFPKMSRVLNWTPQQRARNSKERYQIPNDLPVPPIAVPRDES